MQIKITISGTTHNLGLGEIIFSSREEDLTKFCARQIFERTSSFLQIKTIRECPCFREIVQGNQVILGGEKAINLCNSVEHVTASFSHQKSPQTSGLTSRSLIRTSVPEKNGWNLRNISAQNPK